MSIAWWHRFSAPTAPGAPHRSGSCYQTGPPPGQDEPGQHIGLECRQLIRPGRGTRVTQVSYDGQAQTWASLAFTDPGRPAIDTIDLQETREIITGQERERSGEEAQVLGL